MRVDIVGEDEVTRAIIKRIINDFRQDIIIDKILPARGGQLKLLAPKYNILNSPIILLTDLDVYDCPPSLLLDWFQSHILNPNLIFRIAYGEAESWLMSDRKGFSEWIESDINQIPFNSFIDKRKGITEIVFPYKPSLYLMREIAVHSKNKEKREALIPIGGAKKGPLYNSILIPFIEKHWNISNASNHSTSLTKAIQRIKEFK